VSTTARASSSVSVRGTRPPSGPARDRLWRHRTYLRDHASRQPDRRLARTRQPVGRARGTRADGRRFGTGRCRWRSTPRPRPSPRNGERQSPRTPHRAQRPTRRHGPFGGQPTQAPACSSYRHELSRGSPLAHPRSRLHARVPSIGSGHCMPPRLGEGPVNRAGNRRTRDREWHHSRALVPMKAPSPVADRQSASPTSASTRIPRAAGGVSRRRNGFR